MTRVNLATVLALKQTLENRPADRPHALVDASVLEDILDDLIDLSTRGLAPKKAKKK